MVLFRLCFVLCFCLFGFVGVNRQIVWTERDYCELGLGVDQALDDGNVDFRSVTGGVIEDKEIDLAFHSGSGISIVGSRISACTST